ncbi:MAG: hypothetical protein IPO67_25010 [Deltaproteobacteria bacterium]|nr:hypothetical protein [Deltaproteobacteria bacterium]
MLFVLTALSSALAETQIFLPCDSPTVALTLPYVEQTNVPTDARIVALILPCESQGAESFSVELLGADGERLVIEPQIVSVQPWRELIVIQPEGGLAPNSDFVLRLTPEEVGEVTEVGFSTGEGLVQGLGDAVPSVTIWEPWVGRISGERVLTGYAIVTPVPDPDGLSLVGILSDEDSPYRFMNLWQQNSGGDTMLGSVEPITERPEELCLEVVQIDGRGVETEPVEACAPVERRGCSAVPAAPGLVAAALALLGLRRRASQRGHCVK